MQPSAETSAPAQRRSVEGTHSSHRNRGRNDAFPSFFSRDPTRTTYLHDLSAFFPRVLRQLWGDFVPLRRATRLTHPLGPASRNMSSRKVRIKKLNTKHELAIFTEDKIDLSEYESSAADNQIATGVEQAEENVRVTIPWSRYRWISRDASHDGPATHGCPPPPTRRLPQHKPP